ncbi:uncharacterized protein LOC110007322 isoform X3 [Amborella trichopoda]|uniref:uncharacterized protein LOC110007322 isoform X3 n=1 Tax=Amborella trichopoda TaxID=13333 RepID=UPI0009BD2556|nr:uncharacterized protein LOC110007322 isoform X3 [Amborella trichopoda]|eukprot:XP_020523274.1 uncharacterized protein LOC110007322 isoform X3 [Amborella trichopoda]
MVNLFVKKIRWVVAKKQAKKTRTRFDPLLVDPLAIVQVEPEEQPLEALPPVEEVPSSQLLDSGLALTSSEVLMPLEALPQMEARSCSYRVQVLMQHNGVITKRSLSLFSR